MIEISFSKATLMVPAISIILIIGLFILFISVLGLYLMASLKLKKQANLESTADLISKQELYSKRIQRRGKVRSAYKSYYAIIFATVMISFAKESKDSNPTSIDSTFNLFYLSEVFIVSFLCAYFILLTIEFIVEFSPDVNNK